MSLLTLDAHIAAHPALTLAQRQRLGIEPNGTPLHDDGILGPRTRSGLFLPIQCEADAHPLVYKAVEMALVGARESAAGNNHGYFPHIFMSRLPYDARADQEAFRDQKSGLWCAGFGGWVIQQVYGPKAPYSWSARTLARQWLAHGERVDLKDVQPGDVLCWRREASDGNPAAGHFGFCAERTDELLIAIEGNGTRRGGAVGVYGYSLANQAARGKNPQELLIIARRPR